MPCGFTVMRAGLLPGVFRETSSGVPRNAVALAAFIGLVSYLYIELVCDASHLLRAMP